MTTDRDRLAADLEYALMVTPVRVTAYRQDDAYYKAAADRLIALGWTRGPTGYWSAEGDLYPEMMDRLRDVLPEAWAQGKQIVVADGVTLRFHELPPTLDEERLARAIDGYQLPPEANRPTSYVEARRYVAAAIAKAYREETDERP